MQYPILLSTKVADLHCSVRPYSNLSIETLQIENMPGLDEGDQRNHLDALLSLGNSPRTPLCANHHSNEMILLVSVPKTVAVKHSSYQIGSCHVIDSGITKLQN